jgi:hypothetical protein
MQRKVVFGISIILLISFYSCSTLKKGKSLKTESTEVSTESRILELSKNNNLIKNGFIIKNAKANIESKSYTGNINLMLKVNKRGDFLAIGKGPVGIELFRIYGVNDSVWVIDRINRRIYDGMASKVYEKFGLPADFWQLLIGDIPEMAILNIDNVKKGKTDIIAYSNDSIYDRDIFINRNALKASGLNITSSELDKSVSFKYDEFKKDGEFIFPGKVTIYSKNPMFHVEMKIDNITCQVQDSIKRKLPDYRLFDL